jgi:hypothetical protein
MSLPRRLAVTVLFLLLAAPSHAAFIRNSFGLENPARTITFDEHFFPKSTALTDQYEDLGLILKPRLFYNSILTHLPNNDDELEVQLTMIANVAVAQHVDPFSIKFTEPQSAAAFILESNAGLVHFDALRDGKLIESADAEIGRGVSVFENFFGFQDIVFDEIRVSQVEVDFGAPGVVMDRFELLPAGAFPVPEPAAMLLLPAGALWLLRRCAGRTDSAGISKLIQQISSDHQIAPGTAPHHQQLVIGNQLS